MKKLLSVLFALTILAAACGSDDDETSEPSDTTDDSTETTAPPGTGGDDTPSTTPTDVELTDSFRGVTAETIKVAYTGVDFEKLNNDFGLSLTFASFGPAAQAFADDINDRGGILGRQVEVVFEEYLPVGPADAESLCTKLTQDEEVFVVLNGFTGASIEAVNECYVDTNDTNLIGGLPNQEQIDRASATWITDNIDENRRAEAFAQILADEGELEGLGTFGIIAADPVIEFSAKAFESALTERGADVAFTTALNSAGDEVATRGEAQLLLERARADGVDTIVQIGESPNVVEEYFTTSDEFTLVMLNADRVSGWRTDPLPGIETFGRVIGSQNQPDRSDPEDARCFEIGEAAYGEEVKPPQELEVGEINYWSAVGNACRQFKLFELIATAAGPDLTNESFAEAAATLGDIELAEFPFASLTEGKFDARDTLSMAEWNTAEGRWEQVTDPIDVG